MRVAPGAWRYAVLPAALSLPAFLLSPLATLALLGLAVAVVWFHRDPARTPPADGLLSPADGRVSVVREEAGRLRVGVFMNVTDVHVNRAPLSATVREVAHSPGGHWPAFSKESDRNERVTVDCGDHEVVLVAGTVARRIHPYVEAGESVARGERIGHVSFGSRADVLFPPGVTRADLRVERGDRVRAGETVLADVPAR
ncbi:MAG: protein sorting system archaetidylserine decarboxylase [Haloarculaceae archaeon]